MHHQVQVIRNIYKLTSQSSFTEHVGLLIVSSIMIHHETQSAVAMSSQGNKLGLPRELLES